MTVVRRSFASSRGLQKKFIDGVLKLKAEIGAGGVSTYDSFVIWHHRAMMTLTPPTQNSRNSAHSGPAFLPWHRYMLTLLERNLQRVLNDANFGLPYWDWAADGEKSAAAQKTTSTWKAIGGDGAPVASGPFSAQKWRVRYEMSPTTGQLVQVNRGLNRARGGSQAPRLPNKAQARDALRLTTYDTSPWGQSSTSSFRNRVEGWDGGPRLHNLVHVWVGGDMLASTSPNDPVFFLNHCNEDRMWAIWQAANGITNYTPANEVAAGVPSGHRRRDLLTSPAGGAGPRIDGTFNTAAQYTYDRLTV